MTNWAELATSGKTEVKKDELGDIDEELFLKDNADYEQKLKEHLYLFNEKDRSDDHNL